ncbi:MAG: CRISPR-associated protein Csx3 [Anaerolineales bacterium]
MLSQHLRRMGIAHYLLRAAPDGEGDWFLEGNPAWVRTLRNRAKGTFTTEFVAHMKTVVENRLLPLLVDVGGLPRDEQFGIIRACTHAILLHKEPEGSAYWEAILQESDVPILARLESIQSGTPQISATTPYLQGRISGLERKHPQADLAFGALLERVAGLFNYQETYLERIHLRYAQYPPLSERRLMQQIAPQYDGLTNPWWNPGDLPTALACISPQKPRSLYGRGPVWLAAAIAAHISPAPMTLYDACFGWIPLPEVQVNPTAANLIADLIPHPEGELAEIRCPDGRLEPDSVLYITSPLEGAAPLVLSGKLPRWVYAALAHHLKHRRPRLSVYDPNTNATIPIFS